MTTFTGRWSREEAESFLRETTVPVRLACERPDGSLWMLSLWFRYRGGALWCATASDADVVDYLRRDDRVAFEVSTNDPPYRGVRGEGAATVAGDDDKELLRELLERYLGGTESSLARRLLDDGRDEATVRVDPNRVYSWDFSDRMADAAPPDEPG
ncbi:pyridoxamine 5'-phosphate oxidase family protein [Halostella litorea]|uniref:pyridoxamine 5'-phosphate oxidase family protein n=1 Tax=Halostella litorea TaxID=2528831 RepID=UPI001091D154|nr:pyridoxamine 5'-phosphate oxidase family protein [Halostella litorea]